MSDKNSEEAEPGEAIERGDRKGRRQSLAGLANADQSSLTGCS